MLGNPSPLLHARRRLMHRAAQSFSLNDSCSVPRASLGTVGQGSALCPDLGKGI